MKLVWLDSRDAKLSAAGRPGIDGHTASEFHHNIDSNIRKVRRLVQTGDYHFSRLRIAPIEKADGTKRIIAVPTVQDRFLQRVVLAELNSQKSFQVCSTISFGFQRGRSLTEAQLRALELRQGAPWVVQADIIKFFDRIPRRELLSKIAEKVRSKIARELLHKIVSCELDMRVPALAQIAHDAGIRQGRGLRQGMPASPALSNLLLREFDAALEKSHSRAVRYADDLTIFGKTKDECLRALDQVRAQLALLKLDIPELGPLSKTKLLSPTEDAEFLGVVIRYAPERYKLVAPSRQLESIEKKLFEVATKSYCLANRRSLAQISRDLESITVGYERAMAVAEDRDSFSARLESSKRKALAHFLTELFGARYVAAMTDDDKAILGLADFAPLHRKAA